MLLARGGVNSIPETELQLDSLQLELKTGNKISAVVSAAFPTKQYQNLALTEVIIFRVRLLMPEVSLSSETCIVAPVVGSLNT